MNITFINVGYGECILIEKDGYRLLVDAGSNENDEYVAETKRIRCVDYLRAAGIDRLDAILSTHVHEDHICGFMPIVDTMRVGSFISPVMPALPDRDLPTNDLPNPSTEKFTRALNDFRQLQRLFPNAQKLTQGAVLEPVEGLKLEVLGPSAERAAALEQRFCDIWAAEEPLEKIMALDPCMNNFSLILKVTADGVTALLPGDTNRDGYEPFADCPDVLRADLFKVGHHGQIDGVRAEQLEMIRPKHVVFMSSSDRRYNSGRKEIVEMVRNVGAMPHFTDPVEGPWHNALSFLCENGQIKVKEITLN